MIIDNKLSRESKLKMNVMLALANQVIVIIHGLILPRLYIRTYGSNVYGLVSSITQFLSVVTLMELGMGAVVQSALYSPLAKGDSIMVSKIVKSSERFFSKIGTILLVYTLVLMIVYPLLINNDYGWIYEATLVLIISISSMAEYFFGITYRLLVVADQRAYLNLILQCISYVLNLIICIMLMSIGSTIHIVKFATAIIFLIKPVMLMKYVSKEYDIDRGVTITEEPIKQKWNGIAQHLAYYVTLNTDVIVLTLFSSLKNVAIYSVYNIVTNGISTLIFSLNNGTQALLGNMYANKETDKLGDFFGFLEWSIHNIVVFFYVCVLVLIVPFVKVYTNGINDANYVQPTFAVIFTLSSAVYCLRFPYNMMVNAAGCYKETQTSSIVEMLLNVTVTIILVNKYGLTGVAVGTLVALSYRTIYLAWYLSKNVLFQKLTVFLKYVVKDFIISTIIIFSTRFLEMSSYSYFSWGGLAIKVAVVAGVELLIFNFGVDRKYIKRALRLK